MLLEDDKPVFALHGRPRCSYFESHYTIYINYYKIANHNIYVDCMDLQLHRAGVELTPTYKE